MELLRQLTYKQQRLTWIAAAWKGFPEDRQHQLHLLYCL